MKPTKFSLVFFIFLLVAGLASAVSVDTGTFFYLSDVNASVSFATSFEFPTIVVANNSFVLDQTMFKVLGGNIDGQNITVYTWQNKYYNFSVSSPSNQNLSLFFSISDAHTAAGGAYDLYINGNLTVQNTNGLFNVSINGTPTYIYFLEHPIPPATQRQNNNTLALNNLSGLLALLVITFMVLLVLLLVMEFQSSKDNPMDLSTLTVLGIPLRTFILTLVIIGILICVGAIILSNI